MSQTLPPPMSATLTTFGARETRRKSADLSAVAGESPLCKKYRAHGGYSEDAIDAIKEWESTKDSPDCKYGSLIKALEEQGYFTMEEVEELEYIRTHEEHYSLSEVEAWLGIVDDAELSAGWRLSGGLLHRKRYEFY